MRALASCVLGLVAGVAGVVGGAGPLHAQDAPAVPRDPAGGAADDARVEAPPVPEAPRLFRLSASAGRLSWSDSGSPEGLEVDGSGLVGLELESRVLPVLGFRLAGAYGRLDIRSPAAAGGSVLRAAQYVADLSAVARAAVGPFREAGVVPFVTAGLGTIVHDPDGETGTTRSQGAWLFGGGIEAEIGDRFGARAEWRRYSVQLQTPFDPADRTARERDADRWLIAFSYAL